MLMLGSDDSRQRNFEHLGMLGQVYWSRVEPERESFFGIRYGLLFGVPSTSAARQFREYGRPAICAGIALDNES